MKIIDHIRNSKGKTLFSFEILPPEKGQGIDGIYQGIEPLLDFNPSFIDVTYHREDYVLRKRPGGGYDKVITRKRPGTVAICAAISNKYKIDTVPHIICGGFSKEETENALIELNFLGIDNILALRGDNMKSEPRFTPESDGNQNTLELIDQILGMNQGQYLDEDLDNTASSNFCVGVAGYPEKHHEAPNLKRDLEFLKKKIDLGAEYIVTQMFFDNEAYFRFVEQVRALGIQVPIIPGIKPLTTKTQLSLLPKSFHIDIPELLSDAVEQCKDNAAVMQVGVEWAIQQCKELKAAGVPVLHFYTMSKAKATKAIAKEVF
jgi:methylenetetrahydrofolate reductase (NADPH)